MDIAGDKIKEAREKLGLSQEELGKMLGVSKVTISGYEKGTKNPKLKIFVKIIDILNLTPDQLLNRDISVVSEETIPYAFKISKKEMKLIKELREKKNVYDELLKKFEIE